MKKHALHVQPAQRQRERDPLPAFTAPVCRCPQPLTRPEGPLLVCRLCSRRVADDA